MPYPFPSDPEHINITAINIDALTEAGASVTMPAKIGLNHCRSLRCKVNTGASCNIMPPCIFAKLFPRCITTDCRPTGPHSCDTRLTAYNGLNIPQFGTLDTATEWTPKGHQHSKDLQTRWFVADSPGPAILGFPSSSKLGIVQLNCAVKLTSRCDPPSQPKKPTTYYAKDRCDLTSPPNISKNLIKPYPNQFQSIGQFPGTYQITHCDDSKPVEHVPRKWPIALWPLVHEKVGDFIDQSIIILVEEPTNWVSSLAYSGKANGKLWVCLDPKDLNIAIRCDHYKTPSVEEITHELAGSTCFTKLDGTSSYLCIILNYESSLLMTFNNTMEKVQICLSPLGSSLCTGYLPMDDGPDPHLLWWIDRHCRQCSCP